MVNLLHTFLFFQIKPKGGLRYGCNLPPSSSLPFPYLYSPFASLCNRPTPLPTSPLAICLDEVYFMHFEEGDGGARGEEVKGIK